MTPDFFWVCFMKFLISRLRIKKMIQKKKKNADLRQYD